jgi:pimeloyl-ACP methyl ester carboxylesterase
MDKVYLIAGLGADKRLFNNINLPGYEMIHVDWFLPDKSDTLTDYAEKIINQYYIETDDVVLGDSLGGMLAVEVGKKLSLKKTIVISSIKTSDEAPWYFTVFRRLPVYKIIPDFLFTSMGFMIKVVFGKMHQEDLALFKSMLANSSPAFMRWAMHAVLTWKNYEIPINTVHITGDKDMVFSHKRIKNATIIPGGTHIMVFDRAKELNEILQKIID